MPTKNLKGAPVGGNKVGPGSGVQKHLGDACSDKFEIEVYECACCGFHLGVDHSWLRQATEKVWIRCPNCECKFDIEPTE